MTYTISRQDRNIQGEIFLDGSKSISNRALLIRALCNDSFEIKNLSTSKDTQLMAYLLNSNEQVLDTGAAGTTFRFLTAYLALKDDDRILTGSQRMRQRPIGILVNALRQLGARIDYLEKEGYPPLHIKPPKNLGETNVLSIPASTSSQYLSALLMIAPMLPMGLILKMEGKLVSRPYLDMTLRMMGYFGVAHEWLSKDTIRVAPQQYTPRKFTVEADWSAASYYYAIAALSHCCELTLHGLYKESWQGDAVLVGIMQAFGIETVFYGNRVQLKKSGPPKQVFEWDFLPCPDIAQTLAVVCGALGVEGHFTGLETLKLKETDRIAALHKELAKVQVNFTKLPTRFSKKPAQEFYLLKGKASIAGSPVFQTYEDHRMAMAFAPLAMLGEISVENPDVVEKSYPAFWVDLKKLGFKIN